MSILKNNIISSYLLNGWLTVLSLIFPPIYIKILGIEAYGLIGFFVTIQILANIFDGGFSTSLHRQIAELTAKKKQIQKVRNLIKTVETIYWIIGISIGILIYLLSPLISQKWLSSEVYTPGSLEMVLKLGGLLIVVQWPVNIYKQVLMAMQKQVAANSIYIFFRSLRGILSVLVLLTLSQTIHALFISFAITEIMMVFFIRTYVLRKFPCKTSHFKKEIIIKEWKFSSSLMVVSGISIIASQIDKIVLSKMVSLEILGYYTIASFLAFSIFRVFTPIVSGINPRLIQLVKLNKKNELIKFYHKSCQLLAATLFPVSLTIAFFSHEILFLWTKNIELANNSYLVVSILVLGLSFKGLVYIPNKLQLANKWTSLTLYTEVIGFIFLLPAIYYMSVKYGINGVAVVWFVYYFIYFITQAHFMHKKLIPQEKWRWLIRDVLIPFSVSFVIIGLGRYIIEFSESPIRLIFSILFIFMSSILCTVAIMPSIRNFVYNLWPLKKGVDS